MKEVKYKALVNAAMLGVIRSVMRDVCSGASANFFVTFATCDSGMSEALRKRYPHEMSIILQNQFKDLQVFHEKFSVKLSFSGVEEQIVVPFSSIRYFLDRDCDFALEFQDSVSEGDINEVSSCDAGSADAVKTGTEKKQQGKVIDLTDVFTRK